ncbi:granulocyte-macrophage colony-stimulating factor receptor subunit alpha [Microcaecilia unicolor]|uniref:Granulocyte-macrophage colony-stimulating factor receptor subunit alpha-like n=1 Tax=Microcaecilia unicolor TaxID=1415580 RepID=A0A6P7XYH3_9AMPH|nr:granulocyte-macrophage colony-stimulating factor receptor subunit alpha-like [Microcaecilia unicolor]XP_030055515.1 granulocyte-macrophage colony-stimulating factor receptor subunit alpha-like [Microcaecilia unicolor]
MVFTVGLVPLIWILIIFPKDCILSQDKELEDFHISLTNLKMTVSKPGVVLLTWDCNVTDDIQKDTKYTVSVRKSPGSEPEENRISTKYFEDKMELHRSLSFNVTTSIKHVELSTEAHYIPEGFNGTSAENFSCVAYNVTFMNCSWVVGREAPQDIQYFMTLRQGETVEKCQHYKKNSFKRHIGCNFQNLSISFGSKTYALIHGSSKISQIQIFDKWFEINKYERLNPPVNITLRQNQQDVIVEWKKPETNYPACDECFRYHIYTDDVSKNKKINVTVKDQTSYQISGLNLDRVYTLKMRARLENLDKNYEWGEWSPSIEFGNTVPSRFYIIVILVIMAILIAVFSILLCQRYEVMQKLFPPIPQPKNKLSDINQCDIDTQSLCPTNVQPSQKAETEEIFITSVEEMA